MNDSGSSVAVLAAAESKLPGCFCEQQVDNFSEDYKTFNLVLIILTLPILATLGVFGNAVSIFVYTRPPLCRTSVNFYLTCLAISDIAVDVSGILMISVDSARRFNEIINEVYLKAVRYGLPICYIAQTCSVYFTVLAAIDCYISVCWPSIKKRYCRRQVATHLGMLVTLLSVLYNAVLFDELRIVTCIDRNNVTLEEVCPSPLRLDDTYYRVYKVYMYATFMTVLPFIVLLLLNVLIILKLWRLSQMLMRGTSTIKRQLGKRLSSFRTQHAAAQRTKRIGKAQSLRERDLPAATTTSIRYQHKETMFIGGEKYRLLTKIDANIGFPGATTVPSKPLASTTLPFCYNENDMAKVHQLSKQRQESLHGDESSKEGVSCTCDVANSHADSTAQGSLIFSVKIKSKFNNGDIKVNHSARCFRSHSCDSGYPTTPDKETAIEARATANGILPQAKNGIRINSRKINPFKKRDLTATDSVKNSYDETTDQPTQKITAKALKQLLAPSNEKRMNTKRSTRGGSISAQISGKVASSDSTVMLVMVVALFLICNSIALIVNILETMALPSPSASPEQVYEQTGLPGPDVDGMPSSSEDQTTAEEHADTPSSADEQKLAIIIDVSNFLVVLNSSANFLIYVIFAKSFRRTLLRHAKWLTALLHCTRTGRRDAVKRRATQQPKQNKKSKLLTRILCCKSNQTIHHNNTCTATLNNNINHANNANDHRSSIISQASPSSGSITRGMTTIQNTQTGEQSNSQNNALSSSNGFVLNNVRAGLASKAINNHLGSLQQKASKVSGAQRKAQKADSDCTTFSVRSAKLSLKLRRSGQEEETATTITSTDASDDFDSRSHAQHAVMPSVHGHQIISCDITFSPIHVVKKFGDHTYIPFVDDDN